MAEPSNQLMTKTGMAWLSSQLSPAEPEEGDSIGQSDELSGCCLSTLPLPLPLPPLHLPLWFYQGNLLYIPPLCSPQLNPLPPSPMPPPAHPHPCSLPLHHMHPPSLSNTCPPTCSLLPVPALPLNHLHPPSLSMAHGLLHPLLHLPPLPLHHTLPLSPCPCAPLLPTHALFLPVHALPLHCPCMPSLPCTHTSSPSPVPACTCLPSPMYSPSPLDPLSLPPTYTLLSFAYAPPLLHLCTPPLLHLHQHTHSFAHAHTTFPLYPPHTHSFPLARTSSLPTHALPPLPLCHLYMPSLPLPPSHMHLLTLHLCTPPHPLCHLYMPSLPPPPSCMPSPPPPPPPPLPLTCPPSLLLTHSCMPSLPLAHSLLHTLPLSPSPSLLYLCPHVTPTHLLCSTHASSAMCPSPPCPPPPPLPCPLPGPCALSLCCLCMLSLHQLCLPLFASPPPLHPLPSPPPMHHTSPVHAPSALPPGRSFAMSLLPLNKSCRLPHDLCHWSRAMSSLRDKWS